MSDLCGCCTGPVAATPSDLTQLPGQSMLRRRVGTYATFFETMQAELSRADRPGLAGLRTRDGADPTMALIDAWAVAADVLTFYQERYGNEGYLRTATERRSIFELARLVDYAPRPGVAASVLLAYTLDATAAPLTVPAGTKVQNVPDPGAQMQTFETAEPLEARAEWSSLTPRLARAPLIDLPNALWRARISLTGTTLDLKTGDRLLFIFSDPVKPARIVHVSRIVAKSTAAFDKGTTEVELQPRTLVMQPALGQAVQDPGPGLTLHGATILAEQHDAILEAWRAGKLQGDDVGRAEELLGAFSEFVLGAPIDELATVARRIAGGALTDVGNAIIAIIEDLSKPPPILDPGPPPDPLRLLGTLDRPPVRIPPSSASLNRSIVTALAETADALPQLLVHFHPRIADTYYKAWANLPALRSPLRKPPEERAGKSPPESRYADLQFQALHILHATSSLFGYNAPKSFIDNAGGLHENPPAVSGTDNRFSISLEAVDDGIMPGSLVLLEGPLSGGRHRLVAVARTVETLARDDYLVQAKSTYIGLAKPGTGENLSWRDEDKFEIIRTTLVRARSEPLAVADDSIAGDIGGDTIELAALIDGLQSGRRIIIAGERTDIIASGEVVTGIEGREAAMVTGIEQNAQAPGDRPHTTLKLSAKLGSTYRRDTVRIWANVVKATHGETHSEPLGSGDARKSLQSFMLAQSPLTFVSAPTATGVATTLELRVNNVRWHETQTLADQGAVDRVYVVHIADDAATTVTFGSGEHGARLPSGNSNVRAVYRSGIGRPGNVKPDSITLLANRPLGVREVTNPLRAAGGADAESVDQARRNVPLAVAALDRLVSLKDYADFARSFAGIGHAAATQLSDGARDVVHVTIAGLNDIPIDPTSDILQNLALAFGRYGDPLVPVRVAPRELLALVISANVAMDPDYLWDDVAGRVRQALLDAFAFERRYLARSAYLSEAFSAMQRVAGVVSVAIDVFDAVAESELSDRDALNAKIKELVDESGAPATGQPRAIVAAAAARRGTDGQGRIILLPAQLAFLVPAVPETVVLNRSWR
jgi:hypothetical protein